MDLNFPAILVAAVFITGGIWLIDSLMFAPRRRAMAADESKHGVDPEEMMRRTREPILVEYARSFFPVILVVLLLRSFLVEPFRIPSSSMMPTLLVGDFILVNKFAYGVRLPVLHTKIIEVDSPKRGDVAVFRYPRDTSVDYIKRIVGVPGDEISYRNKMLYVNGQPVPQTPIGSYTGIGSGIRATGSLHSIETINGIEHATLVRVGTPDFPPGCQVLLRGPIKVPEGSYFAMGDNRDNSNDSRCWGLVAEEDLVGQAFAIWMSWDSQRSGFPVAWDRLGQGIE